MIEPINGIEPREMKFASDWEKGFYENQADVIEYLGASIRRIYHEPFTFQINIDGAKLSYTPDFYIFTEDSRVVLVEVKSSKKMRDYYYTRARVITTKMLFPEFMFLIALPKRKGSKSQWKFEEV